MTIITQEIMARQLATLVERSKWIDGMMASFPPTAQPQEVPTKLQMVARIIENGVSGYDYEMNAEEIAATILAVLDGAS